jgi:DNA-binding transcriptional MerR regulator
LSEDRDNVIRIEFGRDRRVRDRAHEPPSAPPPKELADPPPGPPPPNVARALEAEGRPLTPRADPLAELYTTADVVRLFGLDPKQLRRWMRRGIVAPSVERGRIKLFTFQDLISVRAAKGLVDAGVPETVVQKSVAALRGSLPKVVRPLTEMRVVADGQRLVVQDERGAYEPATRQSVLDFSVDVIREDVVRVLRTEPSDADRRSAYQHYLEGCRLDEDETTMDRAREAYERALSLDPSLACAYTNLGNLSYRRSDVEAAMSYYARALALDAEQPEAHYNLGFLALSAGNSALAITHLEHAVAHDPSFADAHFNLALAYEEATRYADACRHWERYLVLDPDGPWAAVARRHLRARS